MSLDKGTILGLLDKLGAPYSEKITLERAQKKLKRYVEKEGVPKELTEEEIDLLEGLNLITLPVVRGVEKKKKKKTKSKKPAPKAPAGPKMDWMTASVQAILKRKTIAAAEKLALDIYLKGGGRKVRNIETNAKINVSRAAKALVAADVIKLGDDGQKIVKA